ncbi:hypothetical protein B0H14DRAFT_3424757 [Mycena olivaceomarginata]|nr:hypothetical protein B0H14DRAFT_3424757 [Mycena olivaceomarginata]
MLAVVTCLPARRPTFESIVAHPEDARQGVSRPQIKKFIESKYELTIGNAQNTQLSKALATGIEKNIFVLPKGACCPFCPPWGSHQKLAPKAKPANASAAKENKPTRAKPTKTATGKKPTAKSTTRTPAKKAATKG